MKLNRTPQELPQKLTIEDILLELKDTDKFDIVLDIIRDSNWRANNKSIYDYTERDQVIVHECDYKPQILNDNPFDFVQTTMSVIEKRWDISRYPMRIKVTYKGSNKELDVLPIRNSVFLRLKDYIDQDIIQSQFIHTDFMIDFINSDCQLITEIRS